MSKRKKLNRLAIFNLISGYVCSALFILLVILTRPDEILVATEQPTIIENNITTERVVYVNEPQSVHQYKDHLNGVIIDPGETHTAVVRGGNYLHDRINIDDDTVHYRGRHSGGYNHDVIDGVSHVDDHSRGVVSTRDRGHGSDVVRDDLVTYERAVERDNHSDLLAERLAEKRLFEEDKDVFEFEGFTVARDQDEPELGDIDMDFGSMTRGGKPGDQLYAYNYPSRGVGAGIGTSALGAGSGAGAGIGAGVGEGIYNGETVPTLGGVGTYTPAEGSPAVGGGGGLVSGAGAGSAAGLTTGLVEKQLGLPGVGVPGGVGNGGYNHHREYELPADGALHIMIHVDGSGSLLSTRVKLDEMKETLLKDALLPYYNNDVDLYNKRVTIVDSSGERTLQFFAKAAHKDNVLAIAFQDEAAPDYHLPNFNKTPQNAYSTDLKKLKYLLSEYKGVYRGVMFQVDRGRTFSKSFKELIECAWNGEGYLSEENLKRYHRDNNQNHIQNKRGVVFSDEYHAKSEADPQYYMDLILKAADRVGLNLNATGAGLTDGKYIK